MKIFLDLTMVVIGTVISLVLFGTVEGVREGTLAA